MSEPEEPPTSHGESAEGPKPPKVSGSAGMGCFGIFVFVLVNFIGFIAVVNTIGGSADNTAALAVAGAVCLAAFALVGGGAMARFGTDPGVKGFGVGLMIGWALVSIFTAGMCTGINPGLYL